MENDIGLTLIDLPESLRETEKYLKRAMGNIDLAEDAARRISGGFFEDESECRGLFDQLIDSCRLTGTDFSLAYCKFYEGFEPFILKVILEREQQEYLKFVRDEWDSALKDSFNNADVWRIGDRIAVREPPVFSSFRRFSVRSQPNYFRFFGLETRLKMQEYRDFLNTFREKVITIVSVYSTDTFLVSDADNRDTKYLTDVITRDMYGEDGAETTSFVYTTSFRDDIEPCTVFILSRGKSFIQPDKISGILDEIARKMKNRSDDRGTEEESLQSDAADCNP